MESKDNRKQLLVSIINSHKIHTQDEFVSVLAKKGVAVTQATLSRDIKEIGAIKVTDPEGGFYYKMPRPATQSGSGPVRNHINVDRVDISGQLCSLRCQPGFASAVGSVIDNAEIPGVMGTIAGDDTVLVMLREGVDNSEISKSLRALFNISGVLVRVAGPADVRYADDICREIYISSQERKTGIARRTPEYIKEKMLAGKAVIAISSEGEFAGFSYIESWGGKSFVANSGLIVAHSFRGLGIARRIKEQTFLLSRKLYPDAKIFSITTGAAVMKMNYEFGFRPVPFSELTDDAEFWKGCEGCRHFDILKSHNYTMCICTGLLYDPSEHLTIHQPVEKK